MAGTGHLLSSAFIPFLLVQPLTTLPSFGFVDTLLVNLPMEFPLVPSGAQEKTWQVQTWGEFNKG